MSNARKAAIGFWLVMIGSIVIPELVSPGISNSSPISEVLFIAANTLAFVVWIEFDAKENNRLFSTRRRLFNICIPPLAAAYYAFRESGLIGLLRLLGWVALGMLALTITCLVAMWINPDAFPEEPEEMLHQRPLGDWESEHWDTELEALDAIKIE